MSGYRPIAHMQQLIIAPQNTFTTSSKLLNHSISSFKSLAMRIGRIPEFLEDSSTSRKKVLEELQARRHIASSHANIMSRQANWGPVAMERYLAAQHSIFLINTEIKNEAETFVDWKRTKARECMGVLFGGLLECSEKGTVVATLGLAIIGNLPTGIIQPGLSPGHYSGKSLFESLVVQAERKVEAERSPNADHTSGFTSHSPASRLPTMVSSKLDTSMGGQKTESTPTRSQDPHLAKPVSQHVRWVYPFCMGSLRSVLTTSTFSILVAFVLRLLLITPRSKALHRRHLYRGSPVSQALRRERFHRRPH